VILCSIVKNTHKLRSFSTLFRPRMDVTNFIFYPFFPMYSASIGLRAQMRRLAESEFVIVVTDIRRIFRTSDELCQ
jgi:hypothetical protein